MSVGVAVLVSASLSFFPMAILGVGVGVGDLLDAGLALGLGALKAVWSGWSIFRCSRDTEIWRAMDISTGSMATVTSPELSLPRSVDGLVMCVCAEDMDDGERLRELAEEAVEGAYWEGGLIICHLGSWN